jgi:hypothetical protein
MLNGLRFLLKKVSIFRMATIFAFELIPEKFAALKKRTSHLHRIAPVQAA